jgi:hypothetical protein
MGRGGGGGPGTGGLGVCEAAAGAAMPLVATNVVPFERLLQLSRWVRSVSLGTVLTHRVTIRAMGQSSDFPNPSRPPARSSSATDGRIALR